jgi:predicted GNAT family N-acyltransferase
MAATTISEYTAAIASTEEERTKAYRLRYSVYIGEQQKEYPEADHHRAVLKDELDEHAAIVLVTRPDGNPCGTVRASFMDCEAVAETYQGRFELARFSQIPRRSIAICSRLAVLKSFRATAVARMLLTEVYQYGIEHDTQLCFEACAPMLKRFFIRYGFREHMPPYYDPVAGTLHRMVLVLDDISHLEQTGSPFLATARRLGVKNIVRPWVNEMIMEPRSANRGWGTDA